MDSIRIKGGRPLNGGPDSIVTVKLVDRGQ